MKSHAGYSARITRQKPSDAVISDDVITPARGARRAVSVAAIGQQRVRRTINTESAEERLTSPYDFNEVVSCCVGGRPSILRE